MSAEDCFSYVVPNEKHRRARNWTDSEMKGLLYIWEEYVTELKKAKRNAKIYEMMAKRLYDLTGEHRHREEIKMKITNMTFQYRQVKMKHTANGGGGTPDWPYYKAIERILSKIPEQNHMSPLDPQLTGASTSQPETSVPQPGTPVIGFIPEYTGSSEEREVKEEDDDGTEISVSSFESRSQPMKRQRLSHTTSLRRRKLRVMEAMLKEQRKMNRAVEDTCREVRRVMHQQNFLQVQSLQLQERMMNLLEKMIPSTSHLTNTHT